MTDEQDGTPAWPKPQSRLGSAPAWLVVVLFAVIAANEVQRTTAQADGHRQRVELAIALREMDRKIDWLLLTQPSTNTERQLRPHPDTAPLAGSK